MSLKTIFRQGMEERRRRRALGARNRDLKSLQQKLDTLLTALGRKAWESGHDLSRFKDVQQILRDAQQTLDDLGDRIQALEKQEQELVSKRTRETERYDVERKGIESNKHDLDKRIREQSSQLESDQKETRQARARLAAIAVERSQLETRRADAAVGDEEKVDVARKLDLLQQEEKALQAGINARENAGKPIEILVASLREESDQIQKQLDALQKKHKEVVDDLDERITALKSDRSQKSARVREITQKRESSFHELGGQLVERGDDSPGLSREKAAVDKVRGESAAVQAEIAGLEQRRDDTQVGAYKKMVVILVVFVVLLAAMIVALAILLSPKHSGSSTRGNAVIRRQGEASASGQARPGSVRDGEITIAKEETLTALLPEVDGWTRQSPQYNRSESGGMKNATLDVRYLAGKETVRVHITDAGAASSLLSGFRLALAMNVRIDNDERSARVTEIQNLPAVERLDKKGGLAAISLACKGRYLIDLRTQAAGGLELLRRFAERLDLSGLP